jgi:DNA-binding transcriptional LysR family regulator
MEKQSGKISHYFLIRWLIPHLHRFQSKYPDVELQINSSNQPVDLNKTNTDMAVYFGYGDWHDIDVELLYKVSLVPVCSESLLKDEHPLNSPQDLHHYPLIHVSKRLYEWPEWLHISKIEYRGFSRGLQLSVVSWQPLQPGKIWALHWPTEPCLHQRSKVENLLCHLIYCLIHRELFILCIIKTP